jgi:hypothetical protein
MYKLEVTIVLKGEYADEIDEARDMIEEEVINMANQFALEYETVALVTKESKDGEKDA